MQGGSGEAFSRRDLLSLIGTVAGSAAMYQAMTSLGFAADSAYQGPIELSGDVRGASVLILGAGLAGMTAALELRKAGYKVQVLEFNRRRGRPQLDAARRRHALPSSAASTQTCEFEQGFISIRGRGGFPITIAPLLDYCKRLNVALEPFVELNHNALSACRGRVRRPAAAHSRHQGRFSRTHLRAARQGDRAGQAR